jgi:hypothetical protein
MTNDAIMNLLIISVFVVLAIALAVPAAGAVFPSAVSREEVPALLKATEFVHGLDEVALVRLVPEQSGLRFVGCPNCTSGRQEGQLASAGPRSLSLRAVEGDALVMAGDSGPLPSAGDVVRLLTADGWVYPYTVVAAEPGEGARGSASLRDRGSRSMPGRSACA